MANNYSDTTPAAPAGKVNIKWQAGTPPTDPTLRRDVSAYMPPMTNTEGGAVPTPPNDATKYLDGTGIFSVPPGSGGGGGLPGATGAPTSIADLIHWVSFDRIALPDNARITRIVDPSNIAISFPAINAGAKYIANNLNSKPIMRLPASSDGRFAFDNPPLLSGSMTYFAVVKFNAFGGTGQTLIGGPSGALDVRVDGSGKLNIIKAFVVAIATDGSALSTGTWYQICVTYNASTGAYAFRAARTARSSGTNAVAISTETNSFCWSRADGGLDLNGDLAESILYNRVLTGTEITTVENDLHSRWAV
jgi:hypothetical protein